MVLEHRAFLLRPEVQESSFLPYHRQHFQAAKTVSGLPYRIPEVGEKYARSSWPALEAAKWVGDHAPEQFDAFDLALFSAVFERTEDVSSIPVLLRAAASVGVPTVDLEQSLTNRSMQEAVWSDHLEALESGIHAIPTVVIGDDAIAGAVPYERYEEALLAQPA